MNDIERITYRDRLREFPEQIREIAKHNTAVRAIMELYARSQILTINDALVRMVVILHQREENANKVLISYMQNSPRPIFMPEGYKLIE